MNVCNIYPRDPCPELSGNADHRALQQCHCLARAALQRHLSPAQIAELGLGVTLFLALAKALITMGLEPEVMDRTVLPTPAVLEAAE
jgi:hypothetical protein